MFRAKDSSNRIDLSRLVQDILNFGSFGLPVALARGQVGVSGAWGCPHTCTCTCTHIHMYTCIEIANGCQHGGIHVYHV